MEEANGRHLITMENRNKLTITEVDDVESFDEERVVIYTSMGTLTVTGYEFRISKLNVDDGQLVIEGEVDSIEYTNTERADKGGGFFSRLFK